MGPLTYRSFHTLHIVYVQLTSDQNPAMVITKLIWFQRFAPTRGGTVWSTTPDEIMGINSSNPASLGFSRWVSRPHQGVVRRPICFYFSLEVCITTQYLPHSTAARFVNESCGAGRHSHWINLKTGLGKQQQQQPN